MALTLELEILSLKALNTSLIYPITSKVGFVKGLANSILTYFLNMIHICPNRKIENGGRMEKWEGRKYFNLSHICLVGSGKMEGWKK